MGQASKIGAELLKQPLSIDEMEERARRAKPLTNGEAGLAGEIVERTTPKTAPRPALQADTATWD
jgi:hypothetical protein